MPHPIETWVREAKRYQAISDRRREEPPKKWRLRPIDYVRIPALAVAAVLVVLVVAYLAVRVAF
jgi:hypothetical protein